MLPFMSSIGGGSARGFGRNFSSNANLNWVASSFKKASLYGSSSASEGAIFYNELASFLQSKGVSIIANSTSAGINVPTTLANDPEHVYFLYNNNQFSSSTIGSQLLDLGAKVVIFTFAANINESSSYSLDIVQKGLGRFWANLNDGNSQANNVNFSMAFYTGNPIIDNIPVSIPTLSGVGYINRNSSGDFLIANNSVLSGKGYNFAHNPNFSGSSMGHCIKDINSKAALGVIPVFASSFGSGYGGSFSSSNRSNLNQVLYSLGVWMCSPAV